MTKQKHTVQDIIDRNNEISDLLDHIQEYSDDLRDGNIYLKDDNAAAFSEIVNEFKQASDTYVSEIEKIKADIDAYSKLNSESLNSVSDSDENSVVHDIEAETSETTIVSKGSK